VLTACDVPVECLWTEKKLHHPSKRVLRRGTYTDTKETNLVTTGTLERPPDSAKVEGTGTIRTDKKKDSVRAKPNV
jgi:hypothetical protein